MPSSSHLHLLSDQLVSPQSRKRGNSFWTDIFLCFVIRYHYPITLPIYRSRTANACLIWTIQARSASRPFSLVAPVKARCNWLQRILVVALGVPIVVVIQRSNAGERFFQPGFPLINTEQWLGAAIESALGQTWCQKEIMVVDHDSTDATLEGHAAI
jgi:hypothetical protein